MRHFADILQKLAVAGNVSNLQIESHPALLSTFQISRAAQLQVGFGNLEPVIGTNHDFQSLAGIFRQFVASHQNAIRLVGTAPHTSSQLVKLGQPEAFGIFNDHNRSIGHVHSNLNHRGGHHDLCLTRDKALHLFVLLGWLHTSVHLAYHAIGKSATNTLIALFHIFQVGFLAFLNQRIDNVDLASLVYLLADGAVKALAMAVKLMDSDNGLASGRQLVNDRHV